MFFLKNAVLILYYNTNLLTVLNSVFVFCTLMILNSVLWNEHNTYSWCAVICPSRVVTNYDHPQPW